MSRRLLGPVGGPVVFFFVAALVFAGLGWVTIAALRVEQAQREAAAQAELGNNLRVALWRLDGRMLPALGVEDSRPFYHYYSADPLTGTTAGPTPLLAAPLPEWMKLHFQLDPTTQTGWESAQVLTPGGAERVTLAWPELPLQNVTTMRSAELSNLRQKYPPRDTWLLLNDRDRAAPEGTLPPWVVGESLPLEPSAPLPPNDPSSKPPPPPGMGPVTGLPSSASDAFKLFGWELKRRDVVAQQPSAPQKEAVVPLPPPVQQQLPSAPGPPAPNQGRGGFGQSPGNDRGTNDLRNRAEVIQRGLQEAKNAGYDPYGGRGYQLNQFPQKDQKAAPAPALPAVPGAGKAGGGEQAKGGKVDSPAPGAKSDAKQSQGLETERLAKSAEAQKKQQVEQFRGTFAEHLTTALLGRDRLRCLDDVRDSAGCPALPEVQLAAEGVARGAAADPRPVVPGGDRLSFNPTNSLGPPPANVHIGSMRPQWITATDGTETLVLVRSVRIDNKIVYQGVVLDWARLEEILKEEVKDLFPNARLVPVRNTSDVVPDRAMTALPVQLDPGVSAEPPPAGWTPLRIGLVLVWVAAIIAFAAVGFSGWSLIDLAERRIRFVSAVTHELRTPLTSLRLYLDLLLSGMIHDEQRRQEYLKTLAVESDRLHRLIDNVLDFARLEKRSKDGDIKPVRVGELLEQLKQTWADRVAADGKELVVISTLPAETELRTDPAMVQQIVANLIDNARKYTRDAEDRRIWLWAKPGGPGRIVFEVEDRGNGVPNGERKAIFKPFRRGAQADANAGGAGLGLALAKQWAEVLGGTLTYRPADGAPGACFRLELPDK